VKQEENLIYQCLNLCLWESYRMNRLKWANAKKDTNWNQVIFSDETTFFLSHIKRRAWNFPGRKKVVRTLKHLIKVNAWGCFSSKGFGKIICFKKNLNAQLMCKIYENGLLPTSRKHLDLESESWKLQKIMIRSTCRY
jgi:hypothetical protein